MGIARKKPPRLHSHLLSEQLTEMPKPPPAPHQSFGQRGCLLEIERPCTNLAAVRPPLASPCRRKRLSRPLAAELTPVAKMPSAMELDLGDAGSRSLIQSQTAEWAAEMFSTPVMPLNVAFGQKTVTTASWNPRVASLGIAARGGAKADVAFTKPAMKGKASGSFGLLPSINASKGFGDCGGRASSLGIRPSTTPRSIRTRATRSHDASTYALR